MNDPLCVYRENNDKKIISLFLAAVLVFFAGAAAPVFSAEKTDAFVYNKVKGCSDALYYDNIEKQTYSHFQYWDRYCAPTNWASPIRSYLVPVSDDYMTVIVPERDGCFTAEYYDASFSYKNSVNIPAELPLFGGFTAAGGYYYVLSGQENPEENDAGLLILRFPIYIYIFFSV